MLKWKDNLDYENKKFSSSFFLSIHALPSSNPIPREPVPSAMEDQFGRRFGYGCEMIGLGISLFKRYQPDLRGLGRSTPRYGALEERLLQTITHAKDPRSQLLTNNQVMHKE